MTDDQQESLPAPAPVRPGRVWCRRCGRPLHDPVSRARRYGAECDPQTRAGHDRRDADQDPIPGL
ncbi:DUF6011 domain-containing protein [Streptomyces sp. Da 82-17]|uniref:DUF6011 domain-containing protein n=1 Tax=Streptomyces sp. Da 82-17 TaxID=3377116 RepID=UPI0038D47388